MPSTAVFGIYQTELQVEMAVGVMRREGFRNTDISVLFKECEDTNGFALSKSTKASEGFSGEAPSDAVLHGSFGWLAGTGVLAMTGAGTYVAAGPLIAALRSAGADGGLTGALVNMGIVEDDARRYEGRILGGHILMSVHADHRAWLEKAKAVFEKTGAEDVASTAEPKRDYAKLHAVVT